MYRNRQPIQAAGFEAQHPGHIAVAYGEVQMRLRSAKPADGVPAGRTEQRAAIDKFAERFKALPSVAAHRRQLERLAVLAKEYQAAVDIRDDYRSQFGSVLNNEGEISSDDFEAAENRVRSIERQIESLQTNIRDGRDLLRQEFKSHAQEFQQEQVGECQAEADQTAAAMLEVAAPYLDKLATIADRLSLAFSNAPLPSVESLLGAVPSVALQANPATEPARPTRVPMGHSIQPIPIG